MDIIIRETGQRESLAIIDPKTGVNYIGDFAGNTGALNNGQFEWCEEAGAYYCDQATYDWWDRVVRDNEALDYRIHALAAEHGSEAVEAAIEAALGRDLEDHAAAVNGALDEAFGAAE